jgi:hypothetical protein
MDELTAIRDAFPAAPDPDAAMLARAQQRLDGVIRAERRHHAAWRTIALAAAVVALVLAGLATAAVATGLFDRDVTRADLDARVETVTRTVVECRAPGDCGPPRVETVREIMGEEADGVLFIDPDGRYIRVGPASNVIGSENPSTYFRAAVGTLEYGKDRSHVEFALPDGGTRAIAWTPGEGTVDVSDRLADGATSRTTLHSGDVVPLLPGTLDDRPYTPDKAVTVDLDLGRGEGYPLWIYPQRNEVFAGQEPWRDPRPAPLVLPERIVAAYGLVTEGPGRYTLPVTPEGATWTYPLRDGGTRTIAWHAGDTSVTVTDHAPAGAETGSETVRIGRQFSGG